MVTIESITANYVIRDIFGQMADVETETTGAWINKKLISKLVNGIFKPYWETGHVNSFKVKFSDGRVACVYKGAGDDKMCELTVWSASNSKDVYTLPSRAVSRDLRLLCEA